MQELHIAHLNISINEQLRAFAIDPGENNVGRRVQRLTHVGSDQKITDALRESLQILKSKISGKLRNFLIHASKQHVFVTRDEHKLFEMT